MNYLTACRVQHLTLLKRFYDPNRSEQHVQNIPPYCTLGYACLPYGLVGAPAEFQRQFNAVWILLQMDDLLVFNRNEQENLHHLRHALRGKQ